MIVMSVPPQQKPNAKRTGKRITFFTDQGSAMKEVSQHTEGPCYVMGAPPSEHTRADPGGAESSGGVAPHMYLNSVIFSPEKGEQNRSHYQQTVKWPHPEPAQQNPATWSQGAPMTAWKQSFPPYLGSQVSYQTQLPDGMVLSQEQPQPSSGRMGEKQQQVPNAVGEAFREPTKSLDWVEQQQAFQQSHKTGILNPQQHVASATGNTSVLQPFQLAFGQPKQNLATGYYQVFQSNRNLPNLNYGGQASSQHQMQQLQEQQMQRLMLQRQQQLQQRDMTQAAPHQQQAHQINQLQPPQQMQQHVQQQQVQHVPLQKLQQNQQVVELRMPKQGFPIVAQSQDTPEPQPPQTQDLAPQNPTTAPQPSSDMHQPAAPRRSRRLSKEDAGPPSENPFLATADQQVQDSHSEDPDAGEVAAKKDVQAAPAGVIQSTRRKRRVSQEVNLETLAQKASEMESLPSRKDLLRPWSPSATAPDRGNGESDVSSAKQTSEESLVPLVIPVSVPVQRAHPLLSNLEDGVLSACWTRQPTGSDDPGRPDHKPSVIVTRRRSLRNSLSESSGQNGGTDAGGDGKAAKSKRRPRPEPLFIPPPKLGTFIAPSVYSSITPYQSHLRSPVRLAENPLALPPYTPPPILSPVREGSGLYFSAILSAAAAAAAGNQGLPPPATPKSATRSLLRSNSTEITPPVLSAMGEATPVSIEPRINIGQRYQAEVPELRERSEVLLDPHKAELVWAPLTELDGGGPQQQRVDDLMHLACSSALCGGGTNQELAMHCLYECKGDIMEALGLLLLKNPIFPRPHPLADYHYSGSDSWTPEERRIFNKGIATYKKDFFMVQKMVSTKTVAQCVEFYYTYKKQVKIGRNGTLMYGDTEVHETRPTEEEVDYKSSQRFDLRKEEEDNRKWEGSGDRKQRESSPGRVTQSLQATESQAGAVLVLRNQDDGKRDPAMFGMSHAPTVPPKPRSEGTARKNGGGAKVPVGQEGEFPCKKCGRVFFKVKSRSAHMKSHAEQEKKAAALRQREAEERAAALARAAVMAAQQNGSRGEQAPARRGSSEDSSDEDGEDVDDDDWL